MADFMENALKQATYINLPTTQGAIITTPTNFIGYYFDIITNHAVSTQSQITDNYLENGTAVQDHIAHSPLQITLSGLCGDIIYRTQQAEEDYIRYLGDAKIYSNTLEIKNKLTSLTTLSPRLNNTMQKYLNKVNSAIASTQRYIGIFNSFVNSNTPLNKYYNLNQNLLNVRLKEVYEKLKWLKDNNIALYVTTPFGDFENMYILSMTLRQGDVNFAADLEITLKQLRFADVKFTEVDEKVMATYNSQPRANIQNNGKTQGEYTLLGEVAHNMGIHNFKIYGQ